ncbi:MAG: holo-ACP synthase [Rickettsiaceae bacterium]|nr:holo-ACP synthase [Rickettsiaceae bacterium]
MIIGIGTDVVQIDRIEKIYDKYKNNFLAKNFHPKECEYFFTLKAPKTISYLAKRFAGKEAIVKAFGSGIGSNFAFKDIAILNDEFGAPYVEIFRNNNKVFIDKKIHISLSDDYPIAVAFAVISHYSHSEIVSESGKNVY